MLSAFNAVHSASSIFFRGISFQTTGPVCEQGGDCQYRYNNLEFSSNYAFKCYRFICSSHEISRAWNQADTYSVSFHLTPCMVLIE